MHPVLLVLLSARGCLSQYVTAAEMTAEFKAGAITELEFKTVLDTRWREYYAPKGKATEMIWQVVTDAAVTGDRIMHAMVYNANAIQLGTPFVALPNRITGELPAPFPKDFQDLLTWSEGAISSLLVFYEVDFMAMTLPDLQIQLLEYIGADVTGFTGWTRALHTG